MVFFTTNGARFSPDYQPLNRVHFAMAARYSLGKVYEAAKEVRSRDVFVIATEYQGLVASPMIKERQAHMLVLNEKSEPDRNQPLIFSPQSLISLGRLSRGEALADETMKPALEQEIKLVMCGIPAAERLDTMAKVYNAYRLGIAS